MPVIRVTLNEFEKNFEALSESAQQGPVFITKEGRDYLVLISASEWERLNLGNVGANQDRNPSQP